MRTTLVAAAIVAMAQSAAPAAAGVEAGEVFERLKSLEGTWEGTPEGQGEEAAAEAAAIGQVVHEFEVSAAGTVVMETMGPGQETEMINMYFLDGDDLLLTHYCSGGNQPRMRLNRETSTADNLVFDFDGGTNLEGASHHIHSAAIRLNQDGGMDSVWYANAGGKPAGEMAFRLRRAKGE